MSLAGTGKTISIRGGGDPFERYQMPVLEVHSKNKGQFNETLINGLKGVAKALKVPENCIVRHFGSDLKTQTRQVDGGLMVKGAFEYQKVEASLRKFIKKYVICNKCGLPELIYKTNKKALQSKCQACGNATRENMNDRIWKVFHLIYMSMS